MRACSIPQFDRLCEASKSESMCRYICGRLGTKGVDLKCCDVFLNEHLSYNRGVAGPKMATGSNYLKKL